MSWIRDDSNSLINLDKVEKIEVEGVEHRPGETGPEYCLIAYFTPGDDELTVWLTSGTEEHCLKALDAIAQKVHMVKI